MFAYISLMVFSARSDFLFWFFTVVAQTLAKLFSILHFLKFTSVLQILLRTTHMSDVAGAS